MGSCCQLLCWATPAIASGCSAWTMSERMPASAKLRSRCTRHTTLRGPNRPSSAGRSATARVRARASGSRMSRLESGGRSTSEAGRILARQAQELVVVPAVDRARRNLWLQRDDAFPVGGLQPRARQGDRSVQLEGPAEAVLCAVGLAAQLADGAFFRQHRRVHADAVEVVLSDEFDDAGRIEAFEHRAQVTEHQLTSPPDHDQGEVEVAGADRRHDFAHGLGELHDHPLDVVALNDAHATSLLRRAVTASAIVSTTMSPAATSPITSAAGIGGAGVRTAAGAGRNAAL